MWPPPAVTRPIPFAQSCEEPPPSDTMKSQPACWYSVTPSWTLMSVGIGFGTREDHGLQARFAQVAGDQFGQAHLVQAGVGHDQRLAPAERLGARAGLAGAAGPDQGDAGNEETVGAIGDAQVAHVVSKVMWGIADATHSLAGTVPGNGAPSGKALRRRGAIPVVADQQSCFVSEQRRNTGATSRHRLDQSGRAAGAGTALTSPRRATRARTRARPRRCPRCRSGAPRRPPGSADRDARRPPRRRASRRRSRRC